MIHLINEFGIAKRSINESSNDRSKHCWNEESHRRGTLSIGPIDVLESSHIPPMRVRYHCPRSHADMPGWSLPWIAALHWMLFGMNSNTDMRGGHAREKRRTGRSRPDCPEFPNFVHCQYRSSGYPYIHRFIHRFIHSDEHKSIYRTCRAAYKPEWKMKTRPNADDRRQETPTYKLRGKQTETTLQVARSIWKFIRSERTHRQHPVGKKLPSKSELKHNKATIRMKKNKNINEVAPLTMIIRGK